MQSSPGHRYLLRCSVGGGHRASGRLFSLNLKELGILDVPVRDVILTGTQILNVLRGDVYVCGMLDIGNVLFVSPNAHRLQSKDEFCVWTRLFDENSGKEALIPIQLFGASDNLPNSSQVERSTIIDVRLVGKDRAATFGTRTPTETGTQKKPKKTKQKPASFFGVGIVGPRKDAHHGTLWRSSYQYGASFICNVGGGRMNRHSNRDTDTTKAWCYIPIFSYPTIEHFSRCAPIGCSWVICAKGGIPLNNFSHPSKAVYLLPGDDEVLLSEMKEKCTNYHLVSPPAITENMGGEITPAIFGSMVLNDRYVKGVQNKNDKKTMPSIVWGDLGDKKQSENVMAGAKRSAKTAEVELKEGSPKKKKIASDTTASVSEEDDDKKSYVKFEKSVDFKSCLSCHDGISARDYLKDSETVPKLLIWINHAYKFRMARYLCDQYGLVIKMQCSRFCAYEYRNKASEMGESAPNLDSQSMAVHFYDSVQKLCLDSVPCRIDFFAICQHYSSDIDETCKWLEHAGAEDGAPGLVYRLQTRPAALAKNILPKLSNSLNFHPKQFTHVVHVAEAYNGYFVASIVKASENYSTSPGAVEGLTLFRQPKVSRAYYKLWEVEKRGICSFANAVALDIGAAPGGWTEYLSERGCGLVVAIDPGKLNDALVEKSNVVHLNCLAEQAVEKVDKLTQEVGVDMIVCDMNCDPRQSARVVTSLSSKLRSGGLLILTVKLIFRGKNYCETFLKNTAEILKNASFADIKEVWLFANGRHERTICATKE